MARVKPPEPDVIPAATLLAAYRHGIFPMAEERDDDSVFWLEPQQRGVMPIEEFHLSRRLARKMRSTTWRMTADAAFDEVIAACAETKEGRTKTWINGLIERSYRNLHRVGHAHSIEMWEEEELIGGLYGVSIGGAFFGESMFSRRTDASKMALVHLVARLKAGGYRLLDAQFVTGHLAQFGTVEVTRARYKQLLDGAVDKRGDFYVLGGAGADVLAGAVLQLITQTS
jgi:leucyl/phenylalanyl-tRNA--protein transferase